MSIRFQASGLEKYAKKVNAAARNIDQAAKKAVKESAAPIHDDIEAWAEKHKRTGIMMEGVSTSDVEQDGNYIHAFVGIDDDKSSGAWHAVFVELGTPTQPADPGIRTAFEKNKSKVKKIQREILKREGIPVD